MDKINKNKSNKHNEENMALNSTLKEPDQASMLFVTRHRCFFWDYRIYYKSLLGGALKGHKVLCFGTCTQLVGFNKVQKCLLFVRICKLKYSRPTC